ncbi:hypothetical protein [Thermosulfurimonas sp. F29]|uniref:hypothetical protein n=1 Tax=Thermosulfurimonas sp. F29 TaxID=2867247 RepID=UPI001C83D67B|nr:hypothetical protein [Thermosulfurimonas sp. F29]MBX6424233.1 hypothetical protein [Thermosulfurimonas sp. F29]
MPEEKETKETSGGNPPNIEEEFDRYIEEMLRSEEVVFLEEDSPAEPAEESKRLHPPKHDTGRRMPGPTGRPIASRETAPRRKSAEELDQLASLEEGLANLGFATRQLFVSVCTLFDAMRKTPDLSGDLAEIKKLLRKQTATSKTPAASRVNYTLILLGSLIAGVIGGLLGGILSSALLKFF